MKLPLHIANKMLQMMQGEQLPASALQHATVSKMLDDGAIQKRQTGKTKALLYISNPVATEAYIRNNFGINNLGEYVSLFSDYELTRAEAVAISGDSKLKTIRTFKGFLVNAYQPVEALLQGKPFSILPPEGSYTFICDYTAFKVSQNVTIVGVENAENFRFIRQQKYLFPDLQPLFVSRYPQSQDLVKWLQTIPNNYLHFGDFDFAGIAIFQNEFKQHLGSKAAYFIPPNLEALLNKYGNRDLYNKQLSLFKDLKVEPALQEFIELMHKYKKGLEQEILIGLG